MTRLGRVAAQIVDRPAPTGVNPQSLRTLIDLFRTVRGVEKHEFQQLIRLLTLSAVDFLDTWFESEILKAPSRRKRDNRHFSRGPVTRDRLCSAASLHG